MVVKILTGGSCLTDYITHAAADGPEKREGMTSAAQSLLEELGLGDRQCVMAAHTYTAHPHMY